MPPRLAVLMPVPGSRVIPTGWEQHHRPVAEGTFTAICRIDKAGAGQGTWNPTTSTYDPPARILLHDNEPCRVQELKQPTVSEVGHQQVTAQHYQVSVRSAITDVEPDHHVTVIGGLDPTLDPSLIGRPLVITTVQRGSVIWERDLLAIDNLG